MGEIADGLIDGTFDEVTGEYLGEGPGYPRTMAKDEPPKRKLIPHHIRVRKSERIRDKYGSYIKITMVGVYDINDKWIKWVKLGDSLLSLISNANIIL